MTKLEKFRMFQNPVHDPNNILIKKKPHTHTPQKKKKKKKEGGGGGGGGGASRQTRGTN